MGSIPGSHARQANALPLYQEFAEAADKLVKIDSLYLPEEDLLDEPESTKTEAPKIPDTLKIHKVVRKENIRNVTYLEFFKFSSDTEPFYRQFYRKPEDTIVCGHMLIDNLDDNTCGYCHRKYNKKEEWLCCPACLIWFREKCFSL